MSDTIDTTENPGCREQRLVRPRVLRLTLKKRWFDMVASGVKKQEYREIKDWIISRLHGKTYEIVEFSNGYGKHVPKVTVEYLGWGNGIGLPEWGATPMKPTIIIQLGRVLSRTNRDYPEHISR